VKDRRTSSFPRAHQGTHNNAHCSHGEIHVERKEDREGRRPIEAVLQEPESHAKLLAQALGELQSFERKYAALTELGGVRAEIARLIESTRAAQEQAAA
jgi:hypothetical protein